MKRILCSIGMALFAALCQAQQTIPPLIKVVVPVAPGAGTDVLARAVVSQLATRLGVTMIVENKPGGSGIIGASAVISAPHDGSVLLFHSSSLVTAAATSKSYPPTMLEQLVPVGMVADSAMLVAVSAKLNVKTPAELVAFARSRPDGITVGSAGVGSSGHLSAELLGNAAKIAVRHIPYKGAAPALVDVAAGITDATVATYSTLAPQVVSGRVVIVGLGSAKPNAEYPDVPPMTSVAPGYDIGHWYGIFAPKGTPTWFMDRLNKEINEVVKIGQVRDLVKADGASHQNVSMEEFGRRVRSDFSMWKTIASERKIVVE